MPPRTRHDSVDRNQGNKGASGALMIVTLERGCDAGDPLLQEPHDGFVSGTDVEMSGCPHRERTVTGRVLPDALPPVAPKCCRPSCCRLRFGPDGMSLAPW
jgi:hypothetical protein